MDFHRPEDSVLKLMGSVHIGQTIIYLLILTNIGYKPYGFGLVTFSK